VTNRNVRLTFWIFACISMLILIASIYLVVQIAADKRLSFFLADARLYTEYFFFGVPVSIQLAAGIEYMLLVAGTTAALVAILLAFQKTISPEVYFVALWVFLVDIEALRLLMLLIARESTSTTTLVSLTRIVYGARFAGLFSIFISGLYAVGIGKERPQTGYVLSLLIGALIGVLMPISIDRFQSSFMLKAGYRELTIIVTGFIVALNCIDYFVSAQLKEERSYTIVGIGLTVAAAAWIWLWDTRPIIEGIIAVILFTGGVLIAVRKLHSIYLWK